MAAMIRKDDWYLSYPEFCSIFVDIDHFRRDGQVYRRDDHVFMRALDYFGAFNWPPRPLITSASATTIVNSLNALLRDLENWRKSRETPASSRSRIRYLPFWKSRYANAASRNT
jgi:hypothetical protein